jgi:hypothetical protein
VSNKKSSRVLNGVGRAPAGSSLRKTWAGTLAVPVALRYSSILAPARGCLLYGFNDRRKCAGAFRSLYRITENTCFSSFLGAIAEQLQVPFDAVRSPPIRLGAAPIARIDCPPDRSPSRTGQSRSPRLGRLAACPFPLTVPISAADKSNQFGFTCRRRGFPPPAFVAPCRCSTIRSPGSVGIP